MEMGKWWTNLGSVVDRLKKVNITFRYFIHEMLKENFSHHGMYGTEIFISTIPKISFSWELCTEMYMQNKQSIVKIKKILVCNNHSISITSYYTYFKFYEAHFSLLSLTEDTFSQSEVLSLIYIYIYIAPFF